MRRARPLVLFVALGAIGVSPASGFERVGDAASVYALRAHQAAAASLEQNLLALIERVPDDERGRVFGTYDRLMGAMSQVALLRTELESAIAAAAGDEDVIRSTLRDEAQFAAREVETTRRQLELDALDASGAVHREWIAAAAALLTSVAASVDRLLADLAASR
jgi:hypothetical protein